MNAENVAEIRDWFAEYCRSFDSEDEDILKNMALKEEHTYHVCSNILEISRGEYLDAEGILIAEAISLLHDVGRFEQYRQFKTFRDSVSVNHAELGAQIIEDYEVLAPLFPRERSIIAHSVEHHNAFAIPKTLPEQTQFFLKLIRDADKLDIWRVFVEYFGQPEEERASAAGLGLPDRPKCSPSVLEQIKSGKMVRLSTVMTLNDFKLMQLSWVYDLNFGSSFRLVAERDCIDELAATLPGGSLVDEAVNSIREFVGNSLTATANSACV
jgi:hypothetical protein